ncbi:thioesterase II family protein [Streptomyces sp. NPDC058718]|uniref:thioesterase II family protein n=1 Tax=Streptomyces sp. NPDC058718 TaxID=3346610 RepID=UPI0036C2A8D4
MDVTWLRRFGGTPQEGPARRVRLVCFPHAGGAATSFLPLSRFLGPAVDVVSVQYPGRQDRYREQPVESVTRLAELVVDALDPADDRPYAFFGHSMGAVVAYETARRLAARSAPGPVRLFLSGRAAPGPGPEALDRMTSDAEVIAAIRMLGGTGAGVLDDPELMELALPALRADYRAIGAYVWEPGPPLDCPFTVLVGDADPVAPVARVAEWSGFTSADTDLRVFPGGHFYLDGCTEEIGDVVTTALGVRV